MAEYRQLSVRKFVANPAAPTVTIQGTVGVTTYGYKAVFEDAEGKKTAASLEGTTAGGNATLNDTDFNRLTVPEPAAPFAKVHWYRTTGGPSQGKIGESVGTTFDDSGLSAVPGDPPVTNETGIGDTDDVLDIQNVTFQVCGGGGDGVAESWAAEIHVEFRVHPSAEWFDLVGPVTGSYLTGLSTFKVAQVRVRMSDYSSGNPKVFLAGNGRT